MSSTPPTPTAPSSFRHWVRNLNPWVKGTFVAVLILLAVVLYVFTGRVTTDDAQVDCHISAIAPQVPGYVVNLLINDNTPVKEGELLVQIDPRTYEAEVAQAKANLEFAEAQANSA
jgi:membrane fusion protein, multidrug efflux system